MVRTVRAVFLSIRILIFAFVLYNLTRVLPTDRASRIRYRAVLNGAREIADYFVRQGGIYIKAAQYLSTVSNLFDTEFTEIFADAARDIETRPYSVIRARFLQEFGTEPEELYLEFDHKPLAAASLGQVHVARIRDGRKVAVKFLHPKMEAQIRTDLRSLRYAVRLTRWFFPHLDFMGHLTEFSNMLLYEVDYRNEAENMRLARENFSHDEHIVIPEVISDLSCSTILTTEFIEGIPIDEMSRLDEAGIDRRALTELLLGAYLGMIFRDRFYHADPHPGNIYVLRPDGHHPLRLGIVDFGAVQFITERHLQFLQRFVQILRARDISALIDLSIEADALRPIADREHYITLAEFIYARYSSFKVDDFYRINPVRFGRMLKMRDLQTAGLKLRDLLRDVQPPRKYIYLARTFTMVLSLAMRLDGKVNLFTLAKPHVDLHLNPRRRGILATLRRRNWLELAERALTRQARGPAAFGPHAQRTERSAAAKANLLLAATCFSAGLWTILHVAGFDSVSRWPLAGVALFGLWFVQQLRRL